MVQQRRLSDASAAVQRHDSTATRAGVTQQSIEEAALVQAIDELYAWGCYSR
jgi:hypothetical protein